MANKIRKWGNSAAIRLPANMLASMNLGIDSEVKLKVEEGKIIIEPLCKSTLKFDLPFSEEALINSMGNESDYHDLLPNVMDSELGES